MQDKKEKSSDLTPRSSSTRKKGFLSNLPDLRPGLTEEQLQKEVEKKIKLKEDLERQVFKLHIRMFINKK